MLAALALASCSEPGTGAKPLPEVTWLVPYTADADIPRHLTSDLELGRAEKLLGISEGDRPLLTKTPFETSQQFQARGPGSLATLATPVNGRPQFVISVAAKMASYDLASRTATFCVFDTILDDCLESEPGKDRIDLSLSSVGLAGRAYTQWTQLKFNNAGLASSPVPVRLTLEAADAERIDTAGNSRLAFVISFGPEFRESGPVTVSKTVTRPETVTTNAIEARLERLVVYEPAGGVIGAVTIQ
jgi:hypothetical protein